MLFQLFNFIVDIIAHTVIKSLVWIEYLQLDE